MLRERSYIEEIQHLKLEVERKFGRRILISSDCIALANDIYRKTNNRISFNTVRRCFNIMKSDYQPSLHTLDSLAIYCGFASFGSFVAFSKKSATRKSELHSDNLLKYITLLFNEVKFQDPHDFTYLDFVRLTINFLEEHENLIAELQKHLSKSYNGQVLYYEYFINIDKLNSFYGEGLQFYLTEKKVKEGQVFGFSLLSFKSWLNSSKKDLEDFYFKIVAVTLDKSTDPIIWARYFSALLFYYEMMGYSKTQILTQSRKYFEGFHIQNTPIGFRTCFEMILAEALLLTGEVAEADYYIKIAKEKETTNVPDYLSWHIAQVLKLFEAWVFMSKNMLHKAKEILQSITTEHFFFLSKQFYKILYLQLKFNTYKRKKNSKELIALIDETGFVKLLDINIKDPSNNTILLSLGNNGQ